MNSQATKYPQEAVTLRTPDLIGTTKHPPQFLASENQTAEILRFAQGDNRDFFPATLLLALRTIARSGAALPAFHATIV